VAVKLCSGGPSAIEDIQSLIVGLLRNDIWMFQCCFNSEMSKNLILYLSSLSSENFNLRQIVLVSSNVLFISVFEFLYTKNMSAKYLK
jgi:hypothetical protein